MTIRDQRIEDKITESIQLLAQDYSIVGPDLARINLCLSFYKIRESGVFSRKEKCFWEVWMAPILVNVGRFLSASGLNMRRNPPSSFVKHFISIFHGILERERERLKEIEETVRQRILTILMRANESREHIPEFRGDMGAVYNFEVLFILILILVLVL